ncbi:MULTISPECIES: hypothetical protein [unclassified Streptomyces]|uniref:hypothetical protein n=1 Tax=unclassified Streptomyces TaxID=2593676 RepID=UPI002E138C8B|nr:hypothetical protein OG533_17910 [Streptomyces sp. NBC_01186]WSS42353.1 hypothetical protein OG220_18520 [Streptomyces sp. NBC_01187]
MSRLALPYRTPAASVVEAADWQLVVEGEELALPEALGDWDYQMDIELKRSVTVDVSRARAGSGLPDDAVLGLAAVWTATGSNLRGSVQRVPLAGHGIRNVELRETLRGTDLGGVLTLDTVLVLSRVTTTSAPFAPHRAGSLLWSDQASMRLQGDAPQFPMTVIDFAHTSFPEDAAWHLQIGPNLHSAAMGALLLLINARNETVATAFTNAAKPRAVDRAVLSMVYADCARIMVEHALQQEQFVDGADFPEDSLGATLLSLFHQLLPGSTVHDLRLRREHSPSLFASELQAAARIFREG